MAITIVYCQRCGKRVEVHKGEGYDLDDKMKPICLDCANVAEGDTQVLPAQGIVAQRGRARIYPDTAQKRDMEIPRQG